MKSDDYVNNEEFGTLTTIEFFWPEAKSRVELCRFIRQAEGIEIIICNVGMSQCDGFVHSFAGPTKNILTTPKRGKSLLSKCYPNSKKCKKL